MTRRARPRDADRPHRSTVTRASATEAARNFSELISRVLDNAEVFVVERGGR